MRTIKLLLVFAQEVQTAFKEEKGLDASKYGLWCSDTMVGRKVKKIVLLMMMEKKKRRITYRTNQRTCSTLLSKEKTRLV